LGVVFSADGENLVDIFEELVLARIHLRGLGLECDNGFMELRVYQVSLALCSLDVLILCVEL
jgi:hypothetical protein